MKSKLILPIFSILFLFSCGQSISLSEADYAWMPYKGNETLVFKSNTGETDTIFFIRKDTLWGLPDPALSRNEYEIAAIFCRHSVPSRTKGKIDYWNNYFFKIKKTMSKKAQLFFHFSTRSARFYRLSSIKTDSLDNVSSISFATSYGKYNDIYIISGEDYLGSFQERSNFITKLYWSKSNGLVRYDKKDGVYWELIKN